jgi:hypothetical protein
MLPQPPRRVTRSGEPSPKLHGTGVTKVTPWGTVPKPPDGWVVVWPGSVVRYRVAPAATDARYPVAR